MIYPLPPQELDDKTLSKQIKAIAQVLCNVKHTLIDKNRTHGSCCADFYDDLHDQVPIKQTKDNEYSEWASKCRANYLELVKMGLAAYNEFRFRGFSGYEDLSTKHRYANSLMWARDNVPDLPIKHSVYCCCSGDWICDQCTYAHETTPFPLTIPEKYKAYDPCSHKEHPMAASEHCLHDNIIESYRNYYRAKYERSIKGSQSVSMSRVPYYSEGKSSFEWTRRERPEWLDK